MRHSPRHLVRRRQRLSQTFSIDFTLSANAFAEPAYASMTNFTADVLSRSIANPNGIFAQPSYALLKNFRTDVLDSPIAQSIDREPERRHQVILCSSDELHGRPAHSIGSHERVWKSQPHIAPLTVRAMRATIHVGTAAPTGRLVSPVAVCTEEWYIDTKAESLVERVD
jgi:hypothetical protein